MKSIPLFLIFCLHLLPFSLAAQSVTLISWNLKDMGQAKDAVEIRFIAETLCYADVVAIQEVVAGKVGPQSVAKLAVPNNLFDKISSGDQRPLNKQKPKN